MVCQIGWAEGARELPVAPGVWRGGKTGVGKDLMIRDKGDWMNQRHRQGSAGEINKAVLHREE